MDQVLNELSLCGHHHNVSDALKALEDLYKASRALSKIGFTSTIRVTENFNSLELAQNYTCNDWIWDKYISKEYRDVQTALRSRLSKAPYVEKLCTEEGMTELQEYICNKKPCLGLALAHMWDIPALSLIGPKCFDPLQIEILKSTLLQDGDIELSAHQVSLVKNKNDVESIENTLKQKFFPVSSGEDLIRYSEQFFKDIVFCPNVVSQLKQFGKGYQFIDKLKNILTELDIEIRKAAVEHRPFMPKGIVFTPGESETVRTNPKLTGRRSFLCPAGITRICYPHVDITDGDRMHILPDIAECKVYIGYVGPHLPTKKY